MNDLGYGSALFGLILAFCAGKFYWRVVWPVIEQVLHSMSLEFMLFPQELASAIFLGDILASAHSAFSLQQQDGLSLDGVFLVFQHFSASFFETNNGRDILPATLHGCIIDQNFVPGPSPDSSNRSILGSHPQNGHGRRYGEGSSGFDILTISNVVEMV